MTNTLHWITSLILVLTLSACGGGSSTPENGVGGTGITQGRISQIQSGENPSITVNNIQFDTRNARFIRDGETVEQQSDFKPGEIITIKGVLENNTQRGIAREVIFDDTLEGPVTAEANGQRIEILGQTILTDSNTLFYGFNDLGELKRGFIVEVSGFFNAKQQILASTLKLQQTTTTVDSILQIKGHIHNIDINTKTFKINQLTVNYARAVVTEQDLKPNAYVLVRTLQPLSDDVMIANKVFILNTKLDANTFYQRQGLISRIDSATRFEMDGIPVELQLNTVYLGGNLNDLKINQRIIISGKTNEESVLLADEIRIIDRRTQILLEGYIEALDSSKQQLSVLGKNFALIEPSELTDETSDRVIKLRFDQFKVGDFVSVLAYPENTNATTLKILFLAKRPEELLVRVLNVVKSSDPQQNRITLFGYNIEVTNSTLYFDVNAKPIPKKDFFAQLNNGETLLDIIGFRAEIDTIAAEELYIDNSW